MKTFHREKDMKYVLLVLILNLLFSFDINLNKLIAEDDSCTNQTNGSEIKAVPLALLRKQRDHLLDSLERFNVENNQNKDKKGFLDGFSKALKKTGDFSRQLPFPGIVYEYLLKNPDSIMPPKLMEVFPYEEKWISFLHEAIKNTYENEDTKVLQKMVNTLKSELSEKGKEDLILSLSQHYEKIKPRGFFDRFKKRFPYEALAMGAALGDERAFEKGQAILTDYFNDPQDDDYAIAGRDAIVNYKSDKKIVIERKKELLRKLSSYASKNGKENLFQAGD
jgi:hypothetical protein